MVTGPLRSVEGEVAAVAFDGEVSGDAVGGEGGVAVIDVRGDGAGDGAEVDVAVVGGDGDGRLDGADVKSPWLAVTVAGAAGGRVMVRSARPPSSEGTLMVR